MDFYLQFYIMKITPPLCPCDQALHAIESIIGYQPSGLYASSVRKLTQAIPLEEARRRVKVGPTSTTLVRISPGVGSMSGADSLRLSFWKKSRDAWCQNLTSSKTDQCNRACSCPGDKSDCKVLHGGLIWLKL